MGYAPGLDPPLAKVDLVEVSFSSDLLMVLYIKLLLRHERILLCFWFCGGRRRGVSLPFSRGLGCVDRFKASRRNPFVEALVKPIIVDIDLSV